MEVVVTARRKVTEFAELYPLYCSTDQRPDVLVSRKVDNLMLVEVPFSATVKKTILGVTDQQAAFKHATAGRVAGYNTL